MQCVINTLHTPKEDKRMKKAFIIIILCMILQIFTVTVYANDSNVNIVSTYFIVTGLSGEEALVCRTCTFGDLYAGIGTILGIAGIYLIAIGTLYLTPFKHCCL